MNKKIFFGMLLGKAINDLPKPPKFSSQTPLSSKNVKKTPIKPYNYLGKVVISSKSDNKFSDNIHMPLHIHVNERIEQNLKTHSIEYRYKSSYYDEISKAKLIPFKQALKKSKPIFKQIKITVDDDKLSEVEDYNHIYGFGFGKNEIIDVLYKLPNGHFIVKIQDESKEQNDSFEILNSRYINGKHRQVEVIKKLDKNSVSISDVYKNMTNIKSKEEDLENVNNIVNSLKECLDNRKISKDNPDNDYLDNMFIEAFNHFENLSINASNKKSQSDQFEM